MKPKYLLIIVLTMMAKIGSAQQDTLKVIAYNMLHYGDGCQGSNSFLHRNFEKVIQYTNPDILGMVKVQAIQRSSADGCGLSNLGFADSILVNAFNAAYPAQYNYCTYTNSSCSNDIDLLFYNQHKLGFCSVTVLSTYEEDFDLYKLYYLDPNLPTTHDTTFIYVVLNHTDSSVLTNRNQQDSDVVNSLKGIFYHLPNLISMGDFNVATSTEQGYELYATTADTNFLFDDPPFHPDGKFSYPLNWNKNGTCAAYLNTSTRSSSTVPNSCGASGGAKDWIEHIFLSKWIIDSTDYITYIKNSYQTIGNDGKHFKLSINDSTGGPKNTSAPSSVVNALYSLSDKYPIMVKLKVTYNTTGTGPVNPVINGINELGTAIEKIQVNNPVHNEVIVHFPNSFIGQKIEMMWYDLCGRLLSVEENTVTNIEFNKSIDFSPGVYLLRIQIDNYSVTKRIIQE